MNSEQIEVYIKGFNDYFSLSDGMLISREDTMLKMDRLFQDWRNFFQLF